MSSQEFRLAIWYVSLGMEAYLMAVVLLRRLFGILPVFSSYLCFIFTKSVLLWLVHLKRAAVWYFFGYWAGESIAFTLGFLVIVELFTNMLKAYPSVAAFCRTVLVLVLGALAISSVVLARLDSTSVTGSIILLERSVRYFQIGLLVCYFAMARFFRLSIHPWQRAIALGYGLFATAGLAHYALLLYFRYRYVTMLDLVGTVAYALALGFWAFYLTVPVREPAVRPAPAAELVELEAEIRRRMEEVNRALWGVLRGRQA